MAAMFVKSFGVVHSSEIFPLALVFLLGEKLSSKLSAEGESNFCIWYIQCPSQCPVSPKLSISTFLVLQVRCFCMPWYWVAQIGHHLNVVFIV